MAAILPLRENLANVTSACEREDTTTGRSRRHPSRDFESVDRGDRGTGEIGEMREGGREGEPADGRAKGRKVTRPNGRLNGSDKVGQDRPVQISRDKRI
jgi:hypothetical protein